MKTICVFLIFLFQSSFAKDKPAKAGKSVIPQKLEIRIDTKNPSIQLNGIILKDFHRATIQKILGKPSRIKKHSFRSYTISQKELRQTFANKLKWSILIHFPIKSYAIIK